MEEQHIRGREQQGQSLKAEKSIAFLEDAVGGGLGLGDTAGKAEGRIFPRIASFSQGSWSVPSGHWGESQAGTGNEEHLRKETLHPLLALGDTGVGVPCPPFYSRPPALRPRITLRNAPQSQPGALANPASFLEIFAHEPRQQNNPEGREDGEGNILEPLVSGFPSHRRRAKRSLPRTKGRPS